MTISQVEKRLAALEREVVNLRETIEYQQAVQGIRRGLISADRGEGDTPARVFARIRRKQRRQKR